MTEHTIRWSSIGFSLAFQTWKNKVDGLEVLSDFPITTVSTEISFQIHDFFTHLLVAQIKRFKKALRYMGVI